MASGKIIRRIFFVHPSIQLKYIAMSVLPALLVSVFCGFFLLWVGELALSHAKANIELEIPAMDRLVVDVTKNQYSQETVEKVLQLRKEVFAFQQKATQAYVAVFQAWDDARRSMLMAISLVLVCVVVLALLYSHRIAGPVFRLKRCIDLLADGKDVGPIQIRNYDEFKELAVSLETLRVKIKENKQA